MQHCATSKIEDKPLILAITLRLDVGPIVDAPDTSARMTAFLALLRDIPADVIFGAWTKLENAPIPLGASLAARFPAPGITIVRSRRYVRFTWTACNM